MSNGRNRTISNSHILVPGTLICKLEEIDDLTGREFIFGEGPDAFELFVVRKGEKVFGYRNNCPHTHSPLNWTEGKFLDPSRTLIQCSTHGAQFRIEDGLCVSGPCSGDSLTPVSVKIDKDMLFVGEEKP